MIETIVANWQTELSIDCNLEVVESGVMSKPLGGSTLESLATEPPRLCGLPGTRPDRLWNAAVNGPRAALFNDQELSDKFAFFCDPIDV